MMFRRARWATALLVCALLSTTITTAVAQTDGVDDDGMLEVEVPPINMAVLVPHLGEDRLSAGLELMDLEGDAYANALDALWAALVERSTARATIDVTIARLVELRADFDQASRDRSSEQAHKSSLLESLGEVAEARAEVAVAEFMGAGSEDELGLRVLDAQLSADAEALPVHSNLAWDVLDDRQATLDDRLAVTSGTIKDLTTELERLQTDIADHSATLDRARLTDFVRSGEVPQLAEEVLVARWGTTVAAVGQPLVVVDAYVRAARLVAAEQPTCGIEWWMLAGIGKVESGHGTWGGSTVDHNGDTSGTIIGLVLNGENGTASIPDSDGGVLDGDTVFDRAVGPMQFIPSSWRFFGRDGNGDDVADPHNLYDAAAAAGDLLCWVDGSLSTDAGLRAALFSYNHHQAYVEAVLRAAAPFRAVVIPDPPPPEPASSEPDVGSYLATLID
ncbi:MAG: lytic transglycosylase domain-containing protein [Acidimicrobiales bacterium]